MSRKAVLRRSCYVAKDDIKNTMAVTDLNRLKADASNVSLICDLRGWWGPNVACWMRAAISLSSTSARQPKAC
jgi:hypothetical protein